MFRDRVRVTVNPVVQNRTVQNTSLLRNDAYRTGPGIYTTEHNVSERL